MRALVVEEDSSLALRELLIPQPNDYQVLVEMVSCGICNGTDMKIIDKQLKGVETYPFILGYNVIWDRTVFSGVTCFSRKGYYE